MTDESCTAERQRDSYHNKSQMSDQEAFLSLVLYKPHCRAESKKDQSSYQSKHTNASSKTAGRSAQGEGSSDCVRLPEQCSSNLLCVSDTV